MTDPDNSLEIMLDVCVNGQAHRLPAFSTLADLVDRLGHAPESIATAVNGAFVARHQRPGHVLCCGDQVHCFKPIVGG